MIVFPSPAVELVINNTWGGCGAVESTTEVRRVRKDSATAEEGWLKSANPCVAAELAVVSRKRWSWPPKRITGEGDDRQCRSVSQSLRLVDALDGSVHGFSYKGERQTENQSHHQADEDITKLLRTNRPTWEVLPGRSHEYSLRADPPKPSHP